MALRKSMLHSSLWAGGDELRAGMDASQYKDYLLMLLFIKYISDKYAGQSNIAIATLWVDLLGQGGIEATVQRAFSSSIAGEIPPDQALPEVWVVDANDHARTTTLLHQFRNLPHERWLCPTCDELVEGPFTQCWNCGAMHSDRLNLH
jgi:hypothetical protein